MRNWVFMFIILLFASMVLANNPNTSGNSYVLNDFVVRSLSSSMLFDSSKKFSIGVGYKQFSNENYILGGFRFNNFNMWSAKIGGYFNVIVPIRYIYEDENFFEGWWRKIWLDAWLYLSF